MLKVRQVNGVKDGEADTGKGCHMNGMYHISQFYSELCVKYIYIFTPLIEHPQGMKNTELYSILERLKEFLANRAQPLQAQIEGFVHC